MLTYTNSGDSSVVGQGDQSPDASLFEPGTTRECCTGIVLRTVLIVEGKLRSEWFVL
jgi:hypothetical protein